MPPKEAEFTGRDGAKRLQRLQALCSSGPNESNAAAVDGILIIGGVDSFHCMTSQAVLKYLFLGSSGQELLGAQVISQEFDRLEDVILLITRQRVEIFYSSESDAAVKILPVLSQTRHVTEHVMHDALDIDDQETRKIAAFKQMVQGVKRIGIPFGVDTHGKDLDDRMIPEKWPLIQSFGLENDDNAADSKGFFTMNHSVVNVSSALRQAMAELDDFNAKRIMQEVEPLMMHHFHQFLTKLDTAESAAARDSRPETEMGEDLLSFYEFGTMQFEPRGLQTAPTRGSRVLYGKRTSLLSHKSSSSALLANSGGVSAFPATHMLVQTEDPFTGVRFARTYFLSTGKVCKRIVDQEALVHPSASQLDKYADERENSMDTKLLIELYVLLLRGFQFGKRAFVSERHRQSGHWADCVASVKRQVIEIMNDHSQQHANPLQHFQLPPEFLEQHLELGAVVLDACGRESESSCNDWELVYFSLSLAYVPSQITPTETLGSITVGDTILYKQQVQPKTSASACICVTKSFPYFRSWIQAGQEADFAQAFVKTLQSEFMLQNEAVQLGRPLAPMDTIVESSNADSGEARGQNAALMALPRATLLLDSEELPELSGVMYLFTGGFLLKTAHVNPLLISFAKHLMSYGISTTKYDELVLLRLELKADAEDSPVAAVVPFHLSSRVLYLPLLSGTRFQEEILHALTTWKATTSSLNLHFFRPHDMAELDGETPREGSSSSRSADLPLAVQRSCDRLVRKKRNVSSDDADVVDSLFPTWFIPKDANLATTLQKPSQDPQKLCVPITLVIGIPGSDVAGIASSIRELSAAGNNWTHVSIDMRVASDAKTKLEQLTHSNVQARLTDALQEIKRRGPSTLYPRILLSVIGYCDVLTVAAAIKTATVPIQCKISAAIACVSAIGLYQPDCMATQQPFPKLFDQMTAGFATHIVLTHTAELPPSQLGRLRFRMDQVNPFADIQVLSQDVFEGPMTSLCAVNRFESVYYKQYRDVYFGDWDKDVDSWRKYVAELEPKQIPESIRFKIAPGMDASRFQQLVCKELTPFAKATKSMGSSQWKSNSKGIRIAQSIAVEKLLGSNGLPAQQNNPEDEYGLCWCVDGRVVFADDPANVYTYVSTGSFTRRRHQISNQQQPKDQDAAGGLELVVTGFALRPNKIRSLLMNCYAPIEAKTQSIRHNLTVSIEEKRALQKQHAMDPLPEGYLFDGTNYVDFSGGRYEFHPDMPKFIEQHVASTNESAKQTNLKVEEHRKVQQTYVEQVLIE